jgi:hypothetical protein
MSHIYLNYHHGVAMDHTTMLRAIEFVLPAVFEKIPGNLECYVKSLEAGSDLRD